MAASRARVRGRASARANGACQARTETTAGRSLRRWRTTGAAMPSATAPIATVRAALERRKARVSLPASWTRKPARDVLPVADVVVAEAPHQAGLLDERDEDRVHGEEAERPKEQ